MPRNRMVKAEFWDDEKLSTISRDARLTFIGLWTHSDDYGVVKGHHSWLKNKIYPYESINVETFQKWLGELEKILCIIPFDAEGEKFYYIRNFDKHQVINRPSEHRNPKPSQQFIDEYMNTHGILSESSCNKREVKEKYKEKYKEKGTFVPPTLDQITKYCKERKNSVDPQRWLDHYTANGWMIGKNKMKDWKAAVRTWEQRGDNNSTQKTDIPRYVPSAEDKAQWRM